MKTFDFNPFDPDLLKNPYPIYEKLRSNNRVYYNELRGFWVVSRYEDVKSILKNTEDFSSAEGVHLILDTNGCVDKSNHKSPIPLLIQLDPPQHTRMRTLVQKAFTPSRIVELEPTIRNLVNEYIDGFISKGECDIVEDFASPIPVDVISIMVGFDKKYRKMLRNVSRELVQTSSQPGGYRPYLAELFPVLIEEANSRKKNPRDDLLTELIHTEIDGERLTDAQLYAFFFLLLVAGSETTTNLLSTSLLTLNHYPDIRNHLVKHTEDIPNAVEEFLRFESPAQGLVRTTTKDINFAGVDIPKGEKVLLLYGAANRDSENILRSDSIKLDRSSREHLAFGYGVHFCLGANLARLEAKIALEELLSRIPNYTIVNSEPSWLESGIVRGLKNLNITFTPEPR